MKPTAEQLKQLEEFGIMTLEGADLPSTDKIDIVYNKENAVILLDDLDGFVIQPHQVVKITKFFSKERLTSSPCFRNALSSKKLIPVTLEEVKNLDIAPPKSPLDEKIEETRAMAVDNFGRQIPIDTENPYIESALENEAKIEEENIKIAQSTATAAKASEKLKEIRKKKKSS